MTETQVVSSVLKQHVKTKSSWYEERNPPTDFFWTSGPVSHFLRRQQILEKYPEVQELYGYDCREALLCSATIAVQLGVCYGLYVLNPSWVYVLILSYAISGTLNHSLFLAMHELCHCFILPKRWMNEWFSIFSNIPMGIPAAIQFRRYHLEHHVLTGVDGKDPDLPTVWEGDMTSRGRLWKLLWVCMIPFSYTFRPLIRKPKEFFFLDKVNWIIILCWDVIVLYYFGSKCLFYFIGGAFMSMGLHPMSGHFISEHYMFPYGSPYQETFSYYGPANLICYNAGYHVEHHDFPHIPGFRLPQLKKMAPEFYDNLPSYSSWTGVLWNFIFMKEVNCFSRLKRVNTKGGLPPGLHRKCHAGAVPQSAYWGTVPSEKHRSE